MNPAWTGLLVLLAYLLGSIPSGVLFTRRLRIDLTRSGSGSTGATNVARTAGITPALLTLLLDVTKGVVPPLIAAALISESWAPMAVGLAAILGHIFSVFLRFRGGKGVATAFGVFLVVAPSLAIISAAAFAVVAAASRYVSLASMVAAAMLPLAALALGAQAPVCSGAFVVAGLILFTHRDNIRRLRRGEEPTFGMGRGGMPSRG